jgi:hypothetical protein
VSAGGLGPEVLGLAKWLDENLVVKKTNGGGHALASTSKSACFWFSTKS